VESWIASLRASRASPGPSPGSSEAKTTSGGSGPTSHGCFAKYDQDSSCWRTCPVSHQEWAYCAGLIDGEGCIGIYKNKSGKAAYYGVRIDVGMAMKATHVIAWLRDTFGGSVSNTRKMTERWDAATAWRIFGEEAATFLRGIRPHLMLKARQCDLALRLHSVAKAPWCESKRLACEEMKAEMHRLNRRGPPRPEDYPQDAFAVMVGDAWMAPNRQRDLFDNQAWRTYSSRWPSSGTMRSGTCSERPTWARRTGESDGSAWPTPTAADSSSSGAAGYSTESGRHSGTTLTDAVRAWFGRHRSVEEAPAAHINPRFVEALMGVPGGWVSATCSAVEWSRWWRLMRSELSRLGR
jgi:hypothetical protein